MRLKILTSALVVTGLLLFLSWPFVVGPKPLKEAGRAPLVSWGRRALVYFGVTSGVWVATAFSAMLLARQTKREFLDREREMLQGLVEGALRDHER